MADKTLTLSIETKADTAGVASATTSVDAMEAALQKLEKELPEVAANLRQVSQATQQLEQSAAPATQGTKALTDEKQKLGKGSADSGRAVLETSRALEDLQYGIGGVLNNLPGLVQMLGGGAGLAGIISIVAVGLTQLFKHMGSGKDEIDKLAGANADAIQEFGATAIALEKQSTAMAKAEAQAKALNDAWGAWSTAINKGTEEIKANAEETDNAAASKQRLMDAEKALELARVDADDSLSDPEKIRRKNEIQGDFSEKAQQVEQEAFAKQKALAEDRAALEAKAAAGLEEKARRAEEAKKRADDLKTAGETGAGQAARGAGLLGVLREELVPKLKDDYGLAETPEANMGPANNVSDAKRQAQAFKDLLEKAQQTINDRISKGEGGEGDFQILKENQSMIERLTQAIAMMTDGQAAAKALEKDGPSAKAQADALGNPDAIRKEAEARRKAAEDATRQAAQFGRQASESGQIFDINREREEITGGAAVGRAEEAEQKRKQQEQEKERKAAEKEAEALRSAQSGLREIAGMLPSTSAAAGVARGDAGSLESLANIVDTLVSMMEKSKAVKETGAERKIKQLEQRVNSMRQADKA